MLHAMMRTTPLNHSLRLRVRVRVRVRSLQIMANDFAADLKETRPTSWSNLLDVVFMVGSGGCWAWRPIGCYTGVHVHVRAVGAWLVCECSRSHTARAPQGFDRDAVATLASVGDDQGLQYITQALNVGARVQSRRGARCCTRPTQARGLWRAQCHCRPALPRQVKSTIASYDCATLLVDYVEGTRQFLFDKVNAWLDYALGTQGADTSDVPCNSRAFLLLAG